MATHKCTQEQKITDLQKSFNDLDKRDALQANENKNMSEQIKAIKDTVSNVSLVVIGIEYGTGRTSGIFTLKTGESLKTTYSVVPTMKLLY